MGAFSMGGTSLLRENETEGWGGDIEPELCTGEKHVKTTNPVPNPLPAEILISSVPCQRSESEGYGPLGTPRANYPPAVLLALPPPRRAVARKLSPDFVGHSLVS